MTKKRIILFWMCIFVTALKCFLYITTLCNDKTSNMMVKERNNNPSTTELS